jgi:tetratricopeptide (TPR) repeat protein
MHPYPEMVGNHLQTKVYVAPLIILALLALVVFSYRKTKLIVFGTVFFFVNIALVLQLLPVGAAIIAERYSYVPYIGLFIVIGYGYVWVAENKKNSIKRFKNVVLGILAAWILFLCITSFNRIKVWKRGDFLFEDILLTYKNQAFVYNNLGFLCYNQLKDYDRALINYNQCLQIDSTFDMAHRNRGILNFNIKKYPEALIDFNNAIRLKPKNADIYLERANTYSLLNEDDKAIADYNVYLAQHHDNSQAYHWRGVAETHSKRSDDAIADFNSSLALHPNNYESYYWRGLSYYDKKMTTEAIRDLSKSIELDPSKSEVYAWRGLMYYSIKNLNAAIADYSKAISINPNDMASLVNRAISYKELKQWKQSFDDINKAATLGCKFDNAFYEEVKRNAGVK